MSNKTNKSFAKRIKVTKGGKLMARRAGGNHFNAKESRATQLNRKGKSELFLTNKAKSRFMPHQATNNKNKLGRE
jgi:ribosomal protein L35